MGSSLSSQKFQDSDTRYCVINCQHGKENHGPYSPKIHPGARNRLSPASVERGYVPQHRTFKLQDTRQDREQHHETSTQTRMTERHHGKKMAPVAPPTIERRRQLIVMDPVAPPTIERRRQLIVTATKSFLFYGAHSLGHL
ncbi:hypothetical protein AVEN_84618-1 [Araneus ventricosus]|uniref:Uncharacterized protein n=1 Tax=Araneus ventricosus TaxID=182803 RepID=A0A4Y2C2Z0_ARAVE|nr:hypothetical protein AVEN_84618-1 [Araneus ventricosus]